MDLFAAASSLWGMTSYHALKEENDRGGRILRKIGVSEIEELTRGWRQCTLRSLQRAADAIQELLGQADPKMTRRAYAHIADRTLQKAVKKLPSFG
jgi:integrase